MLNQIVFETQSLASSSTETPDGISIQLFRHINRIRQSLEDVDTNLIVCYIPKALANCIDVVLSILNQFSKNKMMWNKLASVAPRPVGPLARSRTQSRTRAMRKGMEVMESESDDGAPKDQQQLNDPYLTAEDRQDIEEMRDEDRRSNEDLIAGEEEEEELDYYSDLDDESYGDQEDNEEDQIGEFSDEEDYYNEDEDKEMEEDYNDEEMEEEGEHEQWEQSQEDGEINDEMQPDDVDDQIEANSSSEPEELRSMDDEESLNEEEAEDVLNDEFDEDEEYFSEEADDRRSSLGSED